MRKKQTFVLVERDDGTWTIEHYVHGEQKDSSYPITYKPTAREAMSRVLQLLDLGPVAPQTHPERVGVELLR